MNPAGFYVDVVEDVVALSAVSGLSLADASEVLCPGSVVTQDDVAKVSAFRDAVERLHVAMGEVI